MIDDGLSRREVLKRMDELKLRVEDVKALVLTHEHSDHIKGLAVWCKNWSGSMFCSSQTRCAKMCIRDSNSVARAAEACHIPAYEEDQCRGLLRYAIVRMGYHTDEVMLTIVTRERRMPHYRQFITALQNIDERITTVAQNINPKICLLYTSLDALHNDMYVVGAHVVVVQVLLGGDQMVLASVGL